MLLHSTTFWHILGMKKYNKSSSILLLSEFIKSKVLNLNLYRIKDNLNLAAQQITLEYKKTASGSSKNRCLILGFSGAKKKGHGNTLHFNFYQSKKQHIIIM